MAITVPHIQLVQEHTKCEEHNWNLLQHDPYGPNHLGYNWSAKFFCTKCLAIVSLGDKRD